MWLLFWASRYWIFFPYHKNLDLERENFQFTASFNVTLALNAAHKPRQVISLQNGNPSDDFSCLYMRAGANKHSILPHIATRCINGLFPSPIMYAFFPSFTYTYICTYAHLQTRKKIWFFFMPNPRKLWSFELDCEKCLLMPYRESLEISWLEDLMRAHQLFEGGSFG